ncbi:MarR family transcriptional regulator [Streptomyces sp. KLOTTS4A1]|uniref:MarR family transcriptional regulator n=1 Tax=Streptomyces sp. KLOTTS4A1 TaxID=3390996 RepID=UPI0039F4C201
MSAVQDFHARGAVHSMIRALEPYEADRATCAIRISGNPGGSLHLREGRVVSAGSPGAPGLETMLLRSGRIPEQEWSAARAAVGPGTARNCVEQALGPLIAGGRIGAAELRVMHRMAVYDAMFAIVAGRVDDCRAADPDGDAVVMPGTDEPPSTLIHEAARRLRALLSLADPVAPDGDALLAAPGAGTAVRAGSEDVRATTPEVRQDIVALADGRRTARDIAFRTGRGLYTVTVEASRMLGEGLLARASSAALETGPRPYETGRRALTPRRPEGNSAPAGPHPGGSLPRRDPEVGRTPRTLAPEMTAASWKGIFRRGGRSRHPEPGT